jgi:antiviral helicase SKI2
MLAQVSRTESACSQINSANELILTELILENVLSGFEPEEVVALLSSFVFQEKTEAEPFLTTRLEEVNYPVVPSGLRLCSAYGTQGRDHLLQIADRVTAVQTACRANFSGEEFGNELRFGLVEVVYEWARGMVIFFFKVSPFFI